MGSVWVRREKLATFHFRILRTVFPARPSLALPPRRQTSSPRARPPPPIHSHSHARPCTPEPARLRSQEAQPEAAGARRVHAGLCTGAHFGLSSCIWMAASRSPAHRCLSLDSRIPTPCIPMPALRQNPGHLTECGSLAGPGPKLTTCLAASMVLRRQRGKWQEQRPRELPASPDAGAGRAPARSGGAPLVRCVRPRTDWLLPRSSHPHWPRSPSEPTINCSSCSLEFQPALAVNAREQGIAPAARVAGRLLPLRPESPALASGQLRDGAQAHSCWPIPRWAALCCTYYGGQSPLVHQTFLRPTQTLQCRQGTQRRACRVNHGIVTGAPDNHRTSEAEAGG